MVVAMIVACEVGFWVLIALGLLSRYALRRRRLSNVFLYGTPLLEVILLVVAVVDLRGGATAGARHGIAALYIGITVMFGHRAIRWVDQRVGYHFLGGPLPWRPPRRGMDRVGYEVVEFARTVGAMAIAGALLGLLILVTGDTDRTKALTGFFGALGAITAISLVISVVGAFEAFGKPPKPKPAPRRLRDRAPV
ncbi:hypothetical protein [Embleya sp. NPDC005575]|uniref:hypothetical protein n=1 Tax=Embleya sp. NPDC005575 TaxID=3156892 RepID=UPI0033AC2E61